jgi:hypothetical protein
MDERTSPFELLSKEALWRLEEVCCRFEAAWQAGQRPRIEDQLTGQEEPELWRCCASCSGWTSTTGDEPANSPRSRSTRRAFPTTKRWLFERTQLGEGVIDAVPSSEGLAHIHFSKELFHG